MSLMKSVSQSGGHARAQKFNEHTLVLAFLQIKENNMSLCIIIGRERYVVLTLKFQVVMSESAERSGHSRVQRVSYIMKPPIMKPL